ncbi:MAG: spore protease YyaC [Firmicutes bacterium]|nr:spore protease YyaC [Bacillota bacterium]
MPTLTDRATKSSVHIDDPLAGLKLGWEITARLYDLGVGPDSAVILLGIGTDRSTGDCLGPLVGSRVAALRQKLFTVYGTLDEPVHAGNLREKLSEIHRRFRNPLVIAVDACLGSVENIGCINVGDGALRPGAGVNKNLPPVGHLHITGVVNVGGFMEYVILQNTRLNLVMRMADVIVEGLAAAARSLTNSKTQGSA